MEVTIGTETAVKLCTLVSPEAAQEFMEMANSHRSVPVVPYAGKLTRYLTPHEECGAYGCGQDWPCQTRRMLAMIEALVESAPS